MPQSQQPDDRVIDVPVPPQRLPAVRPSDIVAAWNAATVGAEIGLSPAPEDHRGVRFVGADGEELRVVFADVDAGCWVTALDRTIGLDDLHGLSVCFRLLGLIEQMATQAWTRAHFSIGAEDGPDIHPALLRVAASLPLTSDARFDAGQFRHHAEGLLGPRRLEG